MRWVSRIAAAVMLGGAASLASATIVSYDVAHVAGATWQFDFSVTNDTLGAPLQGFDVNFGYATFSNLTAVSQPSNFTPFISKPSNDPFFPLDGVFSYVDPITGIGAGHSLGGFIVQVDFSGAGTPGAPTWDVFDRNLVTVDPGGPAVGPPSPVPEPETLTLLMLGILGLAVGRRRALRA